MRGWLLLVSGALVRLPRGRPMAMRSLGRHQVPAGLHAFDYVNPDAPKGGELRMVPQRCALQLRQVQPVHAQGHGAGLPGRADVRELLTGNIGRADVTAYGLLAEDVEVAPDRLSRHLPAAARGALPRRLAGEAADVEHRLRDADRPATPRRSSRPCYAEVEGADVLSTSAPCAFDFAKPEPRAAAGGGRHAGLQPQVGHGNGKAKPFDQVDDRHADRRGPVQDRTGALRQGHHLRARPELLGRATCRCASAARSTSTASPSRSTRTTPRGSKALKAGEFDLMRSSTRGRLGAPGQRQALRHGRAGQARVRAQAARGLPELCVQQRGAKF